MSRTLPHPGATYLENAVWTLIKHGNSKHNLNLSVLAARNPPWTEQEWAVEFNRQEAKESLTPNNFEEMDK